MKYLGAKKGILHSQNFKKRFEAFEQTVIGPSH